MVVPDGLLSIWHNVVNGWNDIKIVYTNMHIPYHDWYDCTRSPISMAVADRLVLIWHQAICNHHNTVGQSTYFRSALMCYHPLYNICCRGPQHLVFTARIQSTFEIIECPGISLQQNCHFCLSPFLIGGALVCYSHASIFIKQESRDKTGIKNFLVISFYERYLRKLQENMMIL